MVALSRFPFDGLTWSVSVSAWTSSHIMLPFSDAPRPDDESHWSAQLMISLSSTAPSSESSDGSDDAVHEPQRKRSKSRAGSFVRRRSHASSPSSCSSPSHDLIDATKPRKPTYLLQKEERDELVEQARLLGARLELLKIRAGLPTVNDENSVASGRAANQAVEEEIQLNLLRLGRFQSLLTRQLQRTPTNPVIHLPRDSAKRCAVLEAMKEIKIRRAVDLSMGRLHHLDHTRPYQQEERYKGRDGLYHMNYFQIKLFERPCTARKLFDALQYFHANIEMSVTEMIGQLTVREDSDYCGASAWNQRVLTTGAAGPEELNTVGFAHFYDSYVPLNGTPLGVLAIDTVDVDDLYPYRTHECTHKDIHSVYTTSEIRLPDSNRTVVVLKLCVYVAQHPPQFPVAPGAVDKLHEDMTRWIHVMTRFVDEYVATMAHP